jgi:hypothetical protein
LVQRGSSWLKVCVALWGAFAFLGVDTQAGAVPQDKVTICHATSSVSHPYVQETVDINDVVHPDGTPTGHGTHLGPVYPDAKWGDVIPPFDYSNGTGGTSTYGGLNWGSDGQAIWNAGCLVVFVELPPETTTTTPPGSTTTTTTTPGSTTSTAPGATTTTGSTTTTVSTTTTNSTTTTEAPPPGATPTTAPSSELPPPLMDAPNGAETIPPVEAEVIEPGPQAADLGPLTEPERQTAEAELDQTAPLPPTGQNTYLMVFLTLGLVVGGSILVVGSRRLSRRGTNRR